MKSIPVALQTHYSQPATTTCRLLRIETKGGTVIGMTDLDADVAYNDGSGLVTYKADNGFRPERLQQSADFAVDNTEASGWVADTGVTEQQIRAGLFDYARFRYYRVNYLDLTQGHEVLQTGTLGETKFSGQEFRVELRSLTQQLKQTISKLYSKTCRATFGDAQCGKAFVWVAGTVTALGAETNRIFTDSALAQADNHFRLGVVEWLTGANAGAQMEVDTYTAKTLTLSLALPYAIAVGDTFRVRQDCDKTPATCKTTHANLVNFRGEPFIPTDGGQSQVPGAEIERA